MLNQFNLPKFNFRKRIGMETLGTTVLTDLLPVAYSVRKIKNFKAYLEF